MNAPLGIHRSARYIILQEKTKVKREIWNKSEFMKMFAIVPVYSILLVLLDILYSIIIALFVCVLMACGITFFRRRDLK